MNRNDNSKYFLYIEPDMSLKASEPLEDVYTEAIEYAFNKSKSGAANYSNFNCQGSFDEGDAWRGWHDFDGQYSSQDHLLPNGFITNGICVHYVRWFRAAITGHNLDKLNELGEWYSNLKK